VRQPNVSFRVLDAVHLSRVPRIVRSELQAYDVLATAQRDAAARQPVTPDAVIETSRSVGAPVTEIWLTAQAAESSVAFEVDEPTRAALVAVEVPARVIDLLVALDAPIFYQIALSEDGARVASANAASPLAVQQVMYRLAAAASVSSLSSASLGAPSFARGSPDLCSMFHGMYYVAGGNYSGYTLDGARQMLLMGCPYAELNRPRTMQAVYGGGPVEPARGTRSQAPPVRVDEAKPMRESREVKPMREPRAPRQP
jgi:hypothetical protein